MSRACLMGSFKGASASGYLALTITRANRSAPAATDGTIGATDKIKVTSNARRILMRRRSSKQGADSSSRLGDLNPRKPHYQTELASPVNWLRSRWYQRQLTATNRNKTFKSCGGDGGSNWLPPGWCGNRRSSLRVGKRRGSASLARNSR